MTFALPAGLFLLAALPVAAGLYLRRVRPPEQRVPSLLLWEQVLRLNARARGWGRIRAWLSLLLQLLILLLLILAVSRPEADRSPAAARVIVLDTRDRMQAVDGLHQSALAKARRFAEAAAEMAREDSPIALVALGTADGSPRLIHPFSSDPRALREALKHLPATPGDGDLPAAIQFAREIAAAAGPAAEVQVLTDRPPAESERGVHFVTFGNPAENWGFAAAGAREANGRALLFLRPVSHANAPREVQLDLEQAGRLLDTRRLRLNPGEPRDLHFDFPVGSEPYLARLRAKDALDADQSVQLTVPNPPPRRVLLVSEGTWFVEKALRADESLQFEMLRPGEWNPALSEAFDVTLFDGQIPGNFLEKGRFGFLGTAPGLTPGTAANPAVVKFDSHHPLLRSLNPGHWRIGEQAGQPAGSGYEEVVTGTQGPLLIARAAEEVRWAALLFPPEKSDLPLRASFPVLLQNLLDWVTRDSRDSAAVIAPLDAEGGDLKTAAASPLPALQRWGFGYFPIWRWLALAAFALLLAEWITYHRRVTE
ncbi:MAG TPA: BatA and WFA domain-containing protein [Chthoniobacterales bacterium]